MEYYAKQILDLAIKANDALVAEFNPPLGNSCDALYKYIRDFRMITLGLGLRTGKTSAMVEIATERDLLITSSRNPVHHHTGKLSLKPAHMLIGPILLKGSLPRDAQDFSCQRVFIDAGFMPTASDLSLIIKLLAKTKDQQFIVLH